MENNFLLPPFAFSFESEGKIGKVLLAQSYLDQKTPQYSSPKEYENYMRQLFKEADKIQLITILYTNGELHFEIKIKVKAQEYEIPCGEPYWF